MVASCGIWELWALAGRNVRQTQLCWAQLWLVGLLEQQHNQFREVCAAHPYRVRTCSQMKALPCGASSSSLWSQGAFKVISDMRHLKVLQNALLSKETTDTFHLGEFCCFGYCLSPQCSWAQLSLVPVLLCAHFEGNLLFPVLGECEVPLRTLLCRQFHTVITQKYFHRSAAPLAPTETTMWYCCTCCCFAHRRGCINWQVRRVLDPAPFPLSAQGAKDREGREWCAVAAVLSSTGWPVHSSVSGWRRARSHSKVPWALGGSSQHFHWQDKSFLPQPHALSLYLKLSQRGKRYGPADFRHPWADALQLLKACHGMTTASSV